MRISLKQSKGGTRVTGAHSGFGSGKAWAKAAKGLARGWESALENLQSVTLGISRARSAAEASRLQRDRWAHTHLQTN